MLGSIGAGDNLFFYGKYDSIQLVPECKYSLELLRMRIKRTPMQSVYWNISFGSVYGHSKVQEMLPLYY